MENKALTLYNFRDFFLYSSDFHTVQQKRRQSLITLTIVNKRRGK